MSLRFASVFGVAFGTVLLTTIAGCRPPDSDEQGRSEPRAANDPARTEERGDGTKVATGEGTARPPADAQQLADQARQAEDAGKLGLAISQAQQAQTAAPDDPQIRAELARLLLLGGERYLEREEPGKAFPFFVRAAATVQPFVRNAGADDAHRQLAADALFAEARAHARAGDQGAVFQSLDGAIEAGFADVDALDFDEDLSFLQGTPALEEFLERHGPTLRARLAPQIRRQLETNASFPFTFRLPDVEGKEFSLDDYRGKVLIVDFWGTWCPPCRAEVPHLVALLDEYQRDGLAIVGINYERGEGDEVKEAIRRGIASLEISYPCLVGNDATQDQVPDFGGYPTTLLLDRAGKVRHVALGYQPRLRLETLITELLAEKAG